MISLCPFLSLCRHNDNIFCQSHWFPLFSRSVTEEEREAKYVRMLTSSLLGVKRLLSLLLQNDRTALEPRLAHLVNSGKFWKYGKHKTPQVLAPNWTVVFITELGKKKVSTISRLQIKTECNGFRWALFRWIQYKDKIFHVHTANNTILRDKGCI